MKAHVIENKELCFRSKVDCIGNAGKLQITLRAATYTSRIQPITFLRDRVNHIAIRHKVFSAMKPSIQ